LTNPSSITLPAHAAPDHRTSDTQRAHRARHYSPRRSPGALTQISEPPKFPRLGREGGGNPLIVVGGKYEEVVHTFLKSPNKILRALIQISGVWSLAA
jgi:hypothetical protein